MVSLHPVATVLWSKRRSRSDIHPGTDGIFRDVCCGDSSAWILWM